MLRHAARLIVSLCFAPTLAWAAPTIGGCAVFPFNNYWNTRIDTLPVHASSAAWVASIGANAKLHADWGNNLADNYGIPFVTVTAGQPLVPITYDPDGYANESDPGPLPVPPDAPIEGGPASAGDRHVIVVDTTNCRLHELYVAYPGSGGATWSVFSSATYDLGSNALRPAGWTSADAAGLPIFPGLVRWEEVAAGAINHAIRFTAANIWGTDANTGMHKWIWPARHWSGSSTTSTRPPMGARFRLKASFDITPFDPRTQVILRAFKKYGLVLADAGSNWFFQGVSDSNWPDIVFSQLGSISGSNFEAVDTSPLQIDVNSAQSVQIASVPTNFNADARSDLLWRHAATGQNAIWLMNGSSLGTSSLIAGVSDTTWRVVGIGDFDASGKADILWRNTTTGDNAIWIMDGYALAGSALILAVPDPAWKIAAAGDFDGDGKTDILWRNTTTGDNAVWLMNGFTVATSALIARVADLNWTIASAGDFDGDGKSDILWRNTSTGEHAIWLMNGATLKASGLIGTVPTAWTIAGVGDYDADGRSDILWRNGSTGENAIWLMNGLTRTGSALIAGVPDASWTIVGTGDYDGDGKADVLWRNTSTGENAVWLMNGFVLKSSALISTVADPNWAVVKN